MKLNALLLCELSAAHGTVALSRPEVELDAVLAEHVAAGEGLLFVVGLAGCADKLVLHVL